MLKVAIAGCGKIADDHASQIRRIKGCSLVAVCDIEPLMARQMAERFAATAHYGNLEELLAKHRPDVVHITTPPQTHYSLARQALLAGSHVYVEKPFTLNADEAAALIDLSTGLDLQVTVGHDDQFRHAARELRALVRGGYIGPAPVHMESYYGYELSHGAYAEAVLGDRTHWTRQLPGGLMQNVISHGIARIAEYLHDDRPAVTAIGFTSPFLRAVGETELVDELRVIVVDGNGTTAYFTFSSQMRPSLHAFRIYGTHNALELDQDKETVIRLRGARYTSYAEKAIPPLMMAREHARNLYRNGKLFVKSDFHMKAGMKYLIESFYRSITNGDPPPVPHREILLTATIMDSIFSQVNSGRRERGRAGDRN